MSRYILQAMNKQAKTQPFMENNWDFAGWGKASRISDIESEIIPPVNRKQHKKLGAWTSTAICGNDITSSVLYVSALCASQAGVLAPLVLILVSLVLFLYRKVYAEVGSALPLNGGTYTVLLNTTNKKMAASAACLTLLSYIATAVISANEAMHYAHNIFHGLNIITATIIVLGFFAFLNVIGISESAVVALIIFVIHMVTLTILSLACGYYVFQNPTLLHLNFALPSQHSVLHALFFGFAAAMLGISGFESSANFIEEQKAGVFPKTLRNMWICVAIFNPLVSFLSLGMLPLETIQNVPPDLLSTMGATSLGELFGLVVSFDAVLVLSGAVLTSYVGVTGLVQRMSLDRALPQFLLAQNKWRNTNHWIIVGFFLLCTSILLITHGDIKTLAGVYTLSFLAVMALFAIGNMLLKHKRARLPRTTRVSWPTVTIALLAVLIGFAGNVLMDPLNVEIFLAYFLLSLTVVSIMFFRIQILKIILFISKAAVEKIQASNLWIHDGVVNQIEKISSMGVLYFTKGDNIVNLNKAALYVLENEQTHNLKVVHVYQDDKDIPPELSEHLQALDQIYPQLKIDFIVIKGEFDQSLIQRVSKRLNIPQNMMFIGTPGDAFPHRIESLGGVRVIL